VALLGGQVIVGTERGERDPKLFDRTHWSQLVFQPAESPALMPDTLLNLALIAAEALRWAIQAGLEPSYAVLTLLARAQAGCSAIDNELTHKRQAPGSRRWSSGRLSTKMQHRGAYLYQASDQSARPQLFTTSACSRVVLLNVWEDNPRKSTLLRELGGTLLRMTYRGSAW
jgi:hypothetical protein